MHVELYHPTVELKKIFRKEKDLRRAVRIRAVYLALLGKTAPQIAHVLGYTRRAVQNWVYSYNRRGLAGLDDNKGRGRKAMLNEDQIQWLGQRIEEGPRPEDKVCVFHAADIQSIIQKQFGLNYHVRSVRKLLKKLGYSYVSSRPEHPKGNPEARETFKKKSVLRSGKSVLIILEKQ
jgi:transposase